jgi:pyrroloquinoline quinone (PQQ) biosynthesis protein C
MSVEVEAATGSSRERVEQAWNSMAERYRSLILGHPLFEDLKRGVLPREVIATFVRHWYTFALEVNSSMVWSLSKDLDFIRTQPDLEALTAEKIVDEFCHPRPGGHIRTVEKVAATLGIPHEEMACANLLPGLRAWLDYFVTMSIEAPYAEFGAMYLCEEMFGHLAAIWYDALTTHYGFSEDQAEYFSTHHVADLMEHEGTIGHGEFNKIALQRALDIGYGGERPGWGVEYMAVIGLELFKKWYDQVYAWRDPALTLVVARPRWGGREEEARVDRLETLSAERVRQRVLQHPWVQRVLGGTAPREQVRRFLLNWQRCVLEFSAAYSTVYHSQTSFLRLDAEVEERVLAKVGRELTAPRSGGPAQAVRQTARAFGASDEEIRDVRLVAGGVGLVSCLRRIYREAPLAEIMAAQLWERAFQTEVLPAIGQALALHYGIPADDLEYFHLYARNGVDDSAAYVLRTACRAGWVIERSGWGLEYAATISVEMVGLFLDSIAE